MIRYCAKQEWVAGISLNTKQKTLLQAPRDVATDAIIEFPKNYAQQLVPAAKQALDCEYRNEDVLRLNILTRLLQSRSDFNKTQSNPKWTKWRNQIDWCSTTSKWRGYWITTRHLSTRSRLVVVRCDQQGFDVVAVLRSSTPYCARLMQTR